MFMLRMKLLFCLPNFRPSKRVRRQRVLSVRVKQTLKKHRILFVFFQRFQFSLGNIQFVFIR